MYEKNKLLKLFREVKSVAEEASEDRLAVQADSRLSSKGKEEDRAEIRRQFNEAVQQYREDMLKIVDAREADYTAYYVKVAKDRLGSSSYMGTLMSTLDALKRGYMGKIEIMALMDLYKDNDLAMNMIVDVMSEMKSPYMDLIPDRVTMKMQLNAFESIRGVIRSKVNVNLLDIPARYSGKVSHSFVDAGTEKDNSAAYFGSGYYAIVNELNDDLSLKDVSSSLGRINNSDKNQTHPATNSLDTAATANNKRANAAAKEPKNKPNRKLGSLGHPTV